MNENINFKKLEAEKKYTKKEVERYINWIIVQLDKIKINSQDILALGRYRDSMIKGELLPEKAFRLAKNILYGNQTFN